MTAPHLSLSGDIIDISFLKAPKACALAGALSNEKIEYSTLVECRSLVGFDVVVFDVEVEIPQVRKHPIEGLERIAVFFDLSDVQIPEVTSLRFNFPLVPHLNLRPQGFPKSLCLYDMPYRDLKHQWTALRFVGRIREWLALTAKGKLHHDDQPLEPLLSVTSNQIVLPNSLLAPEATDLPEKLYITARGDIDSSLFLVTHKVKPGNVNPIEIVTSVFRCKPQEHGIIQHQPKNLYEISLLTGDSCDFLSVLGKRLLSWKTSSEIESDFLKSRLALIIVFPKSRHSGSIPENNDIWAFVTEKFVKDVGVELGLWEESSDGYCCPIIGGGKQRDVEKIAIEVLNPTFELTREQAAIQNGQGMPLDIKIAAIGVGALGSQLVMNLARSGFGRWTLIDEDRLLPHNLARHALNNEHIGWEKARTVAFEASEITQDEKLFSYLITDIINPGKEKENVDAVLKKTDVILDMSASVSAARHLTFYPATAAKRISFFLSPTGNDSVMLAEDEDRRYKLDELEMQYYRGIIENEDLNKHLQQAEGKRRYGRSCRDITATLPQEMTALHAAIGARFFRQYSVSEEAHITIWRADTFGNVNRKNLDIAKTIRHSIGSWTICTDEYFLNKLQEIRESKKPNETGGVLVGSFDLENRLAYVVDTIPSPPDSKEWPTLYIRGCHGLKQKLDRIHEITNGMLEYVGEWHSHPDASPTSPSNDDLDVFSWLTSLMDHDGLPALMMIVGQRGNTSCFLGEIYKEENLLPTME